MTKPKRHKQNFIKQVIARIDFSEAWGTPDKLPEELESSIKRLFPIDQSHPVAEHEFQVSMRTASPEMSSRELWKGIQWTFRGINQGKQLIINPAFLVITCDIYEGFQKFQKDVDNVVDAFEKTYPGIMIKRFGLRYINHIELAEGNPCDWSKYLVPELQNIFNFVTQTERLTRNIQIIEMAYDDGALRFQFGMHNPDFPAEIRQKIFVLDFDAYQSSIMELETVKQILVSYHSRIRKLFSRCLLDPLVKKIYWGKEGHHG